jgi:Prenyltransferase and squalene oxidase repeat
MNIRLTAISTSLLTILLVGTGAAQVPSASRIRDAAVRGFAAVQVAQRVSLKAQACATTCHLQVMGAFAYRSMREHGLPVDEAVAKADAVKAFSRVSLTNAPTGVSGAVEDYIGTEVGIASSFLVAAHTMGLPSSVTTAAIARAVMLRQQPPGDWTSFHIRAPSSSSSFTFTAYGLRAIQLLSHPSQAAEVRRRVTRARSWLESHAAETTEDMAFQLIGLAWAGAEGDVLRRLGRALAATQRPDGGWNALHGRESDAYSTGQALVALHQAGGMEASDPVYQRGVSFLLSAQAADGSWHVLTRLPSFVNPPYFESGYPYGRDQFISVPGLRR